jgi:hypothetical protein
MEAASRFELYSQYALQIQAVAVSVDRVGRACQGNTRRIASRVSRGLVAHDKRKSMRSERSHSVIAEHNPSVSLRMQRSRASFGKRIFMHSNGYGR